VQVRPAAAGIPTKLEIRFASWPIELDGWDAQPSPPPSLPPKESAAIGKRLIAAFSFGGPVTRLLTGLPLLVRINSPAVQV
jgi:hypothetical protein